MYGKIKDNTLRYAPVNYKLDDGRIIINFNKNEPIMKQYGFKEVEDMQPDYDPSAAYLEVSSYTEDDNKITVNYTVKAMEKTTDIFQKILSEEVNS